MGENSIQSESLQMKIARRHADEYDALIEESNEACDCQDCEACIKLGIEVFDWIIAADQNYRSGVYAGKYARNPKMEELLDFLMRRWHERCERVLNWVAHHVELGFKVEYMAEFEQRCQEAAAIAESLNDDRNDTIMSEPHILLRDKALDDYRNGQTAEFV